MRHIGRQEGAAMQIETINDHISSVISCSPFEEAMQCFFSLSVNICFRKLVVVYKL